MKIIFFLLIFCSFSHLSCMDNNSTDPHDAAEKGWHRILDCMGDACFRDQVENEKVAEKCRRAIYAHNHHNLGDLSSLATTGTRALNPELGTSLKELIEEAITHHKATEKEAAWHAPCCNRGGLQLAYSGLFIVLSLGFLGLAIYEGTKNNPSWPMIATNVITNLTLLLRFLYSAYGGARNEPAEQKDVKALAVVGALAIPYMNQMGLIGNGGSPV